MLSACWEYRGQSERDYGLDLLNLQSNLERKNKPIPTTTTANNTLLIPPALLRLQLLRELLELHDLPVLPIALLLQALKLVQA